MSKKVKSLLLVLCALVFAVAGVFATLAYLQDSADVNNVVSVGDINITMDEAHFKSMDEYGRQDVDYVNRVDENEYHLIPSVTYPKDPTIHIEEDSEPAFVFVKIENEIAAIEAAGAAAAAPAVGLDAIPEGTIAQQMEAYGWEEVAGHPGVYVYNGKYCDIDENDQKINYIVNAKNGKVNVPVFAQFKIRDDINNDPDATPNLGEYEDAEINVSAFVIQVVGFNGQYTNALSQLPTGW